MRKIAPFTLVLVGVCAATALIAPKFVGAKAQSHLEAYLKNSQGAFGYTPELKDYHRGWFTSTATLNLTRTKGEKHRFKVLVKHGPVVFKGWRPHFAYGLANFEPVISPSKQADIDKVFAKSPKKPHFDGSMLITSADNVHLEYHIPSGNYDDPLSPIALNNDWKDFNSVIHFHLNQNKLDKLNADANFGGMVIKAGPQTLKIAPLSFELKSHQYKPDSWIWLGESTLKIRDITLNDPLKGDYSYTGIVLHSSATMADKKLSASQEIKISSLKMNTLSGGPVDFKLSVNKVDPDGWESLLTLIEQDKIYNPWGVAVVFMSGVNLPATKVLTSGFEVSLDAFSVKIEDQILTAEGKFVLPPSPELFKESATALKKISLEFNLKAPTAMIKNIMVGNLQKKMTGKLESQVGTEWQEGARTSVEAGKEQTPTPMTEAQMKDQVDQQLGDLVKRNILVENSGNYTLHATIKDGILYVNDKPLMDLVTMKPVTALNWLTGMVASN